MGVMLNIQNLRRYVETEMIASLVAASSVVGILQIAGITHSYPTGDLEQAFLPNDVVNLILGVPLLLVAAYDSHLLPGTLLYQIYSSLTYVLALKDTQLGAAFFLQTIILISCCLFLPDAYGAADKKIQAVIHRKNHSTIRKDTKEQKSIIAASTAGTKMGGCVLLLWGSLFLVRSLHRLLISIEGESPSSQSRSERAVDIADTILGMAWIFGGFQVVRYSKIALGQALLFQGSMLFVALIMLLVIKPFMIQTETIQIVDIAVVASIGVTIFVPFFIIDRGLRDASDRIKVA